MYEFHVSIKQGDGGRWRWFVHRVKFERKGFRRTWHETGREYWGNGSVYGYDTEVEASNAASSMLTGEWKWA